MGFLHRLFGKPTRDDFAQMYIKAIRASGDDRPIDYDPKEFKLTIQGTDFVSFLGNIYEEYLNTPRADRAQHLLRLIGAFQTTEQDLPDSLEKARDLLLPRVRERAYYDLIRLLGNIDHPEERNFQPKVLCGHLTVNVIIDFPDAVAEISNSVLGSWNVSLHEVLKVARENLWKISNENFELIAPGLYRSPWRDNHDASRMYLHDLIWQLQVKGRHVVATPNRDTLFVTGSDDAEGLLNLAQLIREAAAKPRFMTGQLAVLTGSQWETFLPDPGSPAHVALANLSVESQGTDYAEQKSILEERHEKNGADVFVASFSSFTKKTGGLHATFCVWTGGVASWLPRTDFIGFIDPEKPKDNQTLGFARWAAVQEHAGNLMKPQQLYPERWEVRKLPPPDCLARMNLKREPTFD